MRATMQRISSLAGASAILLSLGSAMSRAQVQASPQSWTSIDVGLGSAGATIRRDTVYEGSGQLFARVAYARQTGRRSAVAIDAVLTNSFAAGDCVPGFTVCAPAFSVAGASVSMLTSVAGPISRDGFNVGA